MIRKLNRAIQNFLRPKRLALGKLIWDRKRDKKQCSCIDMIENENIKSILFLRYDGKIGDMVVNTMMFREVKKKYPNVKIGVVARGAARDIIANNPYVNEIYNYDKDSKKIKELTDRIAEERYDLLVDFSEMLRINDMKFIYKCRARINMGLDKGDWDLFDCSIEPGKDFRWDEHITKRYGAYLKKMGITEYSTDYDVFINPERKEKVREYYETLKKECPDTKGIAVLNPYGASRHRSFSSEKLENIIEVLTEKKYITALTSPPEKLSELEEFIEKLKNSYVYLPKNIKSILDTAGMVEYSDFVITPDTSIVHIAKAFNKPLIAVYREDQQGEYNSKTWGPHSDTAKVIFSKPEDKNNNIGNVNSFDLKELIKNIEEIEYEKGSHI